MTRDEMLDNAVRQTALAWGGSPRGAMVVLKKISKHHEVALWRFGMEVVKQFRAIQAQ